jgi:transposase
MSCDWPDFRRQKYAVSRPGPYNSDLNPKELVWADIKQRAASKNINFKIKGVE